MANKQVWRIQGDVAYGETDPVVTCFIGAVEIDDDTGETSIRQDTRNPVTMKLSEFMKADITDHTAMEAEQAVQKTARAVQMRPEAVAK